MSQSGQVFPCDSGACKYTGQFVLFSQRSKHKQTQQRKAKKKKCTGAIRKA